jgi:hypothetical protein
VGTLRGGDNLCFFCALGRILFDQLNRFCEGLTHKRGDLLP